MRKLSALLAALMLSVLISIPAGATLITYTSLEDLEATFENDTSYIMDQFNLKQLESGSEWFTADYNPNMLTDGGLVGPDTFNIVFPSSNTTFGGKWYIPEKAEVSFTVSLGNGENRTFTLGPRLNPNGKVLPQFLGVRADGGELIKSVEVNLGPGVSMTDMVHNQPSPVPEPATMLLLGFGLIGLATFGRKTFFKGA